MFTVTNVHHKFLLWTSVSLRADADMSVTADRLTMDALRAPVLETRRLSVGEGECFTINARRSEGYRIGDRLGLEQVAAKLPISAGWEVVRQA
jgi:hypothetical protein